MTDTTTQRNHPYRGRFAPSPTGPLHLGSLVAAVGSYLRARERGGAWLLRIEDIDPPREVPGAAAGLLRTLERCGFEWDGPVTYQSARLAHYRNALERLAQVEHTYPCACSRKEIAKTAGATTAPYPGTCREGIAPDRTPRTIRVRCHDHVVDFVDGLQGQIRQNLACEVGDFVVQRADGLFAYQLAVTVDDALQGITEVVRGSDLIDSTPRQIYLQRLLGFARPDYVHLPVLVTAGGDKLSKQTGAAAIDDVPPAWALFHALSLLGHRPPAGLRRATVADLWEWAFAQWCFENVPRAESLADPLPPSKDAAAAQ